MLSVETALDRILQDVSRLPSEDVALENACGRVLAEPVVSRRPQPSFDASAMDGYAFRSADTGDGARLRLVGESAAGNRYASRLGRNEAVRIFTGAPLPDGADAVLPQEDATTDDGHLLFVESIPALRHVRPAGVDFDVGQELLPAGRKLRVQDLSMIASSNHARLAVRRKPRVAVLSIGDELVLPGTQPGPDQTIASNAYAVAELARDAGAVIEDLGIVPDLADEVAAISKRIDADILVTIGGASVGDHDITKSGLAAGGMSLEFWKIAMRPGKPMVFGRRGETSVIGLPGNPVSSFVCANIFLKPLIGAMLGLSRSDESEPALLGADTSANGERATYLRAVLSRNPDGLLVATPLASQDSSLQRALAEADCLLIRPAFADAAKAGTVCPIIRL